MFMFLSLKAYSDCVADLGCTVVTHTHTERKKRSTPHPQQEANFGYSTPKLNYGAGAGGKFSNVC